MKNANPVTLGRALFDMGARAIVVGLAVLLAACTQGPGGGGVGLASGQDPDPATVDFPIFYIRHPVPEEQDNVTRLRPFNEDEEFSATLWKRDRASPGSPEVEITARLRTEEFGGEAEDRYDIKDLAVAPTGLKVAFAMRGPLDELDDEEDPPTWNIWEYDIETDTLRRVITSDIIAEEGQDVSPAYLPDGRIVFSSTRQRQSKAILLDEGRPQYEARAVPGNESAFVLHVMNGDGTDVHQITFNRSSDMDATVLQNGRILFTRWENGSTGNGLHLYTTNPDGTDTQLHYGALSHATGTPATIPDPDNPGQTIANDRSVEFTRAREMSDGRLMVLARERTNVDFGGKLIIVDANNFVENRQRVPTDITENVAGIGPAQTNATLNDVRTIPGPSPGGRFESGFPLWDGTNRILVSWSQCRLLDVEDPTRIVPCTDARLADPTVQTAPPLYSIWMFDPGQNTILPVMQPVEGVMVTEVLAAQPRTPLPAVILDKQPPEIDGDLAAEGAGVLAIRSVYDFMGVENARIANNTPSTIANLSNPTNAAYPNRMIRFVRAERIIPMPDDPDALDDGDPDNSAFGGSNVMRQILGYAPVEPDGSVRMKIPANVAFQLSLLDRNAQRVGISHDVSLSLRPGELLECNGCHVRDPQNPRAHGRKGLYNSAYAGATATGSAFPGTVNTISPEVGDTMARARSRAASVCIDPNTTIDNCGLQSITPSADVVYNEIWMQNAPLAASFSYSYSRVPVSPASAPCFPVWSPACRISIHYATIGNRAGHIHPLWSVPRPAAGVDDGTGTGTLIYPETCTYCHSRVNPADPTLVQLPAASLELTDEDNANGLQKLAFRHLVLDSRPELELDVNGAIQVRLITNAMGEQVPVLLPPPMQAGNARASTRFFNRFREGGTHEGYLTADELRLLSEWLDIGAQYYNDPFRPTPQN